jgi:hypothetical protein
MVESRIKQICLEAMESMYPELVVQDSEIRRTFKFDESVQDWVEDSYSVFLVIVRTQDFGMREIVDVEHFLEGLFGFEFCIDLY